MGSTHIRTPDINPSYSLYHRVNRKTAKLLIMAPI